MTQRFTVLVLAVLMSAFLSAQSSLSSSVVEPRTGTPYPVSLIPPGAGAPHWLMGTAVRDRTIFRVRIYAFGLYVDPDGARAALTPFAGLQVSELERDEQFYGRLLDLDFAMTLRLVMARTVDGDDVAEAFDDALRPRLTRIAQSGIDAATEDALQTFSALFLVDEVVTGTEIVFSCTPEGQLTSSLDGEARTRIESRALCRALFDVYLGSNPVSSTGKRSVIAGFPGLLQPLASRQGVHHVRQPLTLVRHEVEKLPGLSEGYSTPLPVRVKLRSHL